MHLLVLVIIISTYNNRARIKQHLVHFGALLKAVFSSINISKRRNQMRPDQCAQHYVYAGAEKLYKNITNE